jgi:hypothetical protein
VRIEHPNRRRNPDAAPLFASFREVYPGAVRRDSSGWEHYRYAFFYRYEGRTLAITWRCGIGYGQPLPLDGLESAFLDAASVEGYGGDVRDWARDMGYDLNADDGAHQMRAATKAYAACERMGERLAAFFPDPADRDLWRALADPGFVPAPTEWATA